MKAYIIMLAAGLPQGTGFQIGASSLLSFHASKSDAEAYAQGEVAKKYPSIAGWRNHQYSVFEIPSDVEDEGYRFTYQLEPITS